MIKNYGFIEPVITPEDWVLGGVGEFRGKIIRSDFDWTDSFPQPEHQKNDWVDSFGCTNFGWTNAIEVFLKAVFGIDANYSDRGLAILAGNKPYGNDPHTVAEAIRGSGLLYENLLPFSQEIRTWQEWASPSPLPARLKREAKKWRFKWSFNHDWVVNPSMKLTIKEKQDRIMEAMQYSPVCVSVRAWEQNENGIYIKEQGAADTHWTLLGKGEQKKPWICLDSYPEYIKKIDWYYDLNYAKRFTIADALPISWWRKLLMYYL